MNQIFFWYSSHSVDFFYHDKNNEIRSVAVILCVTPAWLPYLRRIRPVDVMDPFNADLSCIFVKNQISIIGLSAFACLFFFIIEFLSEWD